MLLGVSCSWIQALRLYLFLSPFPSLTCLSVFPKVGEGMSPRPEMTLSSLRQYPEGVFYDLDSCKPFSYPDSDGGLGE